MNTTHVNLTEEEINKLKEDMEKQPVKLFPLYNYQSICRFEKRYGEAIITFEAPTAEELIKIIQAYNKLEGI